VLGSSVLAGGDILINAAKNADGSLSVQQTGDVNIVGSTLQSGGDTLLAGNDINVLAQTYTDYEMESVLKTSFGGLKSKAKLDAETTQQLSSSQVTSGGALNVLSGNNVTIGGSEITAQDNINITAYNDLLITAGQETHDVEKMRKKGGFLSGGSFYSSKENTSGTRTTTAYSSLLDTQGDINIDAGSATVVGSDLLSEGYLNVRTDVGDIIVKGVAQSVETYSNERQIDVGFGDALKGLSNPTELVKVEDGQLKFSIGNANYDNVDHNSTSNTLRGSTLSASNSVTLDSAGDTTITSSDLIANANGDGQGNVNFINGGDLLVQSGQESYQESTEETHGSAELSIVVQHQAVEVAKATLALKEATDNVKQAEKDYRKYKKDRKALTAQLNQLEAEYAAGAPGVTYTDLIEMRELLEDVNSDEEWHVAGIALATASATSAATGLAQQAAAAGQSTVTWGFNAGLQLDIDASKTNSDYQESTALASNISGNAINVITGLNQRKAGEENTSTTTISGSNFSAEQINIDTGELNVTASRDTSSSTTDTQNGHITIAQTFWGAAGGPTVSASYNRSESKDKNTTHNNSNLSASDINITTSGDTNVQGGNIAASDNLNLNIGGDLLVESMQNRSSGSNKGFGISGGFGFGGDSTVNTGKTAGTSFNTLGDTSQGVNSVNGGLNASSGRYQTRETVLSSVTGGTVNLNVAGNTNLVGSLLAAIDSEGNDTGNLNVSTGSLSVTDLSNTSYSSQRSAGISTSVGLSDTANTGNASNQDGTDLNINSSNIGYTNNNSYSKSKTLATLGQGNITVGGETLGEGATADLNINRDIDNVDKDFYSIDRQQGNIDLTVDHRLLSEEGRQQIKNDITDSYEFGQDIVKATETLNESDALGLLDFFGALHNNAIGTQLKNDLQRNPENAHILEGLKSGDGDEYAAAMQALGALAQDKFGLDVADITLYNANETTATNLQDSLLSNVKGGAVLDENNQNYGDIFIDAGDGASKTSMVNTLGHETIEVATLQQGGNNDAGQEALASAFGEQLAERVDQAAGSELNSTGGSAFNHSLRNSTAVTTGTKIANTVGNSAVDNRQFRLNEARMLDSAQQAINADSSLSQTEKQRKVTQLYATACAATKCADGVPTDDKHYEALRELQDAGEALGGQDSIVAVLNELNIEPTYDEDGTQEDAFDYTTVDYIEDKILKNDELVTRGAGAVDMAVGGVGTVTFGTATVVTAPACAGVLTCAIPVGAAAATGLSANQAIDGGMTLFGDYESPIGANVFASLSEVTHPGNTTLVEDGLMGAGVWAAETIVINKVTKLIPDSAVEKVTDYIKGEKKEGDAWEASQATVDGEMIGQNQPATFDDIPNISKGERPEPDTYLPNNEIAAHEELFDNGSSRFMTEGNLNKYGPGQRDDTSFVMPTNEADLLESNFTSTVDMEKTLGLPEGMLSDQTLVRVDFPDTKVRMPTGNEAGANDDWIPGGTLPNGNNEAIVDITSDVVYTSKPVKFNVDVKNRELPEVKTGVPPVEPVVVPTVKKPDVDKINVGSKNKLDNGRVDSLNGGVQLKKKILNKEDDYVYHGTDNISAESIVNEGLDIKKNQLADSIPDQSGFSVTTNKQDAIDFAHGKSAIRNAEQSRSDLVPVVLKAKKVDLPKLKSKIEAKEGEVFDNYDEFKVGREDFKNVGPKTFIIDKDE